MSRTKSIKIRLTEDELRQLKAKAGSRGVSFLLRRRALGPDRMEKQNNRFTLLAELARMRNTLVLIARNVEQRPLTEQIQILARLIAIELQLSNIKRRC